MNLKSSIIRVAFANVLNLLSSILISFIIPLILSIESYANIKTYIFYTSFITIFSIGFVDGMYLKYGGKKYSELDKDILKSEYIIYLIIQSIFTVAFLSISFLKQDIILFFVAITIIPMNITVFFNFLYQATGEFTIYSRCSFINTIVYFMINILLVFILKNRNYVIYSLTSIVSYCIVFLYQRTKFRDVYREGRFIFSKEIFCNIKVGIYVLLANIAVMMFFACDRWFVKIFFTQTDFAYYSFALSMLNTINLIINSISITLYSYFSRNLEINIIKRIKVYFIIIGVLSSSTYFLFAIIINLFLSKYQQSLKIISILFLALPYIIVINALYINLYKVKKNSKRYLSVVFKMFIIAVINNILGVVIFNDINGIAFGTTFSFIIWYIYSIKDFKYLNLTISEILFLLINFISFIVSTQVYNLIFGLIIYVIVAVTTVCLFYKKYMIDLLNVIVRKNYKVE